MNRQQHGKRSPDPSLAGDLDVSAVALDDLVANSKPQPCSNSHGSRRKSGVEDSLEMFLSDTGSIILNLDLYAVSFPSHPDQNSAWPIYGLNSVNQDIHENLVNLPGIALNQRQLFIFPNNFNSTFMLVVDQGECAIHPSPEICTLPFGFIKAGDSGSLLVTREGNNPVGLLYAGSLGGRFGVANQIDDVLSELNVTIDGG